ncbi:MAG: murein transglycosylase, partial [Cupriavidus sp.]|nr:murein transglycosylase [Cupriavidus sp.]
MAYADVFPTPEVSQVSSLPVRRLRGWLALAGAAVLLAGCMSGPPPRIETTPSGTGPATASSQKGRLQAASWADSGGWAQEIGRA